jgi:hypothetical protein
LKEMFGLPCKCAHFGKLSIGINVALIFAHAAFAKMVLAQDLKTTARPQTIILKRLCATAGFTKDCPGVVRIK